MKKVRVVLTKDFKNFGNVGDVIEVRAGYARNFLIPNRIAIEEVLANRFKKLKEKIALERQEAISKAKALEKIISSNELTFKRGINPEGKLFGSVTANDIFNELRARGLEVELSMIRLFEPIKTLGKHTVQVRLHTEVVANLNVNVLPEEEKSVTKVRKMGTEKKKNTKDQGKTSAKTSKNNSKSKS